MRWSYLVLAFITSFGLATVASTAGAAKRPTARAADAAVRAAAAERFGDGRQVRAVCNPTRGKYGAQNRRRWRCELAASALPEDHERQAAEGLPVSDNWPWVASGIVQWADGEFEATSVSRLVWAPMLSVETPKLGMVTARRLARSALEQEGFTEEQRAGSRTRCRRQSASAVRCTIGWTLGDVGYVTKLRVAMVPPRADNEWVYSWTMWVHDEYCYAVLKRPSSRCTSVEKVR